MTPVYVQEMRRVSATQPARQKGHGKTIMRHMLGKDLLDARQWRWLVACIVT